MAVLGSAFTGGAAAGGKQAASGGGSGWRKWRRRQRNGGGSMAAAMAGGKRQAARLATRWRWRSNGAQRGGGRRGRGRCIANKPSLYLLTTISKDQDHRQRILLS